jgi:diguanylate cyclase (GGDEF)-like protein
MALEQETGAFGSYPADGAVAGTGAASGADSEVPAAEPVMLDGDIAPTLVPMGPSLLPDPPTGWSDPMTGTDGPRYWDRVFSSERARVRNYKRPVTVALVEICGLDRLAKQWGRDVAERALVGAARTLAREIRSSDHIARIEPARFAILLTETTEIEAINFVERARVSCERDLQPASDFVGVGFGWASPPSKDDGAGDLADALELAGRRLAAELRDLG